MKVQKFFWLLIPLALATATGVYFASCSDSSDELQPNTETVAPATDDDDPAITTRSCTCTAACPIDINIVSGGSANLTICGDLNGTANCTITNTNCTSTTYYNRSTTITASSCICVPPGNIFRVTNNGGANVTIDIIVTGSGGTYPLQNEVIPANSFRDFEVSTNSTCDAAVTGC